MISRQITAPGLSPDNIHDMLTCQHIIRGMTPAVDITAPDVLCAFLNDRIMGPGPFNPIEVGNIQIFWSD